MPTIDEVKSQHRPQGQEGFPPTINLSNKLGGLVKSGTNDPAPAGVDMNDAKNVKKYEHEGKGGASVLGVVEAFKVVEKDGEGGRKDDHRVHKILTLKVIEVKHLEPDLKGAPQVVVTGKPYAIFCNGNLGQRLGLGNKVLEDPEKLAARVAELEGKTVLIEYKGTKAISGGEWEGTQSHQYDVTIVPDEA